MVDAEPRRLLIRGFPHWLKAGEKESLLAHFGATEVLTMPTRGRMRNCVFATFASHEDAKRALGRLHQLCVFQSRLTVQYVQDKHTSLLQGTPQDSKNDGDSSEDTPSPSPMARKPPPPPAPPPLVPRLSYQYPPLSTSILTNITHALTSVPKFYIQVLHLMNLMNLPPPFGPPTPAPPLMDTGEGGSGESDAESEIGDGEGQARPLKAQREVKRRVAHMRPSRGLSPPAKKRQVSSEPQFELVSPVVTKKIALHIPTKIEPHPPVQQTIVSIESNTLLPVVSGSGLSAGAISIQRGGGEVEEEEGGGEGGGETEDRDEERKFISSEELAQNRLPEHELRELGVFKGYSPGEPSLRLYIKNLARQTTEEDLRYVYGRYINWTSDRERNIFDVRLMQSGRMKGQAFVGLPSEEAATTALRETNGYQLAGKPMVVHFARTAKAQPSSSAIS